MIHDYYASLVNANARPKSNSEQDLASGFVDECLIKSINDKENTRDCYKNRAGNLSEKLKLPLELTFEPDFSALPDPSWLGIEVVFSLETPWYSKDDRPFHVLDNPVRKDRVFGVPFMSASSWKGMLRWACRMQAGLLAHLENNNNKLDGRKDHEWIVHLFGNEKGEEEFFQSASLVFYPTWFDKVGFEVINPHNRKTKAGTLPINYEVVPADTTASLYLLYAPMSGQSNSEAMEKLLHAIQLLLETYGISAKRTVGWGTARINSIEKYPKIENDPKIISPDEFKASISGYGREADDV